MEKYCRAGHPADDHMLRMLDTFGNKYTLRIYNMHCFSTATMVAPRRLKVTLYLLCLFCSLLRNAQSGCGANPTYLVVTGDSYSQNGRRVKPTTHFHLLLLPLALQSAVGFGLSNNTSTYFIDLPMKMEPIKCSETSAFSTQTPGR